MLTAETIAAVLSPKARAVVVVHLGGWPADMDPIMELARQRGLVVIEDCAQAHGAFYKGRPVGSIGHAGAFSFCQDKIITTGGEGGLLALMTKPHGAVPGHTRTLVAAMPRCTSASTLRAFAG